MRITIKNVGEVTKEKNFFFVSVDYNKDGKDESKKIYSFNEAAYKAAKGFKADQVYDVKLEKNKNGYWEWASVELAGETAATATSTPNSTRSSSWETPEERARRQVLIVRQSSLAQAVSYVTAQKPDAPVTVDSVLEIASDFEDWVSRE